MVNNRGLKLDHGVVDCGDIEQITVIIYRFAGEGLSLHELDRLKIGWSN
ncbi:hypothetical protein A2U01_0081995, partial [Trifolium medium]|nr:hypothetical protein [Trifolium medium]